MSILGIHALLSFLGLRSTAMHEIGEMIEVLQLFCSSYRLASSSPGALALYGRFLLGFWGWNPATWAYVNGRRTGEVFLDLVYGHSFSSNGF